MICTNTFERVRDSKLSGIVHWQLMELSLERLLRSCYLPFKQLVFYKIWKHPHVAPPVSRWGTKLPKQLWPWPYDCDLWPLWPWHWPSWTWPTTFDLDPRPWPLTLVTLTFTLDHLFWHKAENWIFFTFLTLVTLTFDLWPWPSNSSYIWWFLMCVPNFRSIGTTVWPWERRQMDRHTHRHMGPIILPLPLTWEVKI